MAKRFPRRGKGRAVKDAAVSVACKVRMAIRKRWSPWRVDDSSVPIRPQDSVNDVTRVSDRRHFDIANARTRLPTKS